MSKAKTKPVVVRRYCQGCGQPLKLIGERCLAEGKPKVIGWKTETNLVWEGHERTADGYIFDCDNLTGVIYCSGCGKLVDHNDIDIVCEQHPHGSTTATEELYGGYLCSKCGYEEVV